MLMHAHRSRSRTAAYSLVEVMIGVFVFAIVMLAVFNLFSHSVETAGRSIDLNRVNQALQYQMESLRGIEFDALAAKAGSAEDFVGIDTNGRPSKTSGNPYGWPAFKFSQDIASVSGKSGHYVVTLTAVWTDLRGRARVREYKSWFSEDGLNDYYTESTTE